MCIQLDKQTENSTQDSLQSINYTPHFVATDVNELYGQ